MNAARNDAVTFEILIDGKYVMTVYSRREAIQERDRLAAAHPNSTVVIDRVSN